jgi:hypothetical protein
MELVLNRQILLPLPNSLNRNRLFLFPLRQMSFSSETARLARERQIARHTQLTSRTQPARSVRTHPDGETSHIPEATSISPKPPHDVHSDSAAEQNALARIAPRSRRYTNFPLTRRFAMIATLTAAASLPLLAHFLHFSARSLIFHDIAEAERRIATNFSIMSHIPTIME